MTLLFALVGLLFGGLRGLVLGAVAGFLLGRALRHLLKQSLAKIQSQFVESTFAVVGAVCKADGIVTPDEIQFTEALFERFHLSDVQRKEARNAFRRGKDPDFELESEVDRFYHAARGNQALVQMFLRVQLMAVMADGKVHQAERDLLIRVARRLGLSDFEIAQLTATLQSTEGTGSYDRWSRTARSEVPTPGAVERAFATLGVSPNIGDADLKKAYHKLIRDNHPDRLASKGLPENMRELAEERTREINAAYEIIKKLRGTN